MTCVKFKGASGRALSKNGNKFLKNGWSVAWEGTVTKNETKETIRAKHWPKSTTKIKSNCCGCIRNEKQLTQSGSA